MTLLDKLKISSIEGHGIEGARVAHFAFADGQIAYTTELELKELVFKLEVWCKQIRLEMGSIH